MSAPDRAGRPALRVIRGDATDEEIAALLAVLVGRSRAVARPAPPVVTAAWNDRAAGWRRPPPPGPGAWRAAGWPR